MFCLVQIAILLLESDSNKLCLLGCILNLLKGCRSEVKTMYYKIGSQSHTLIPRTIHVGLGMRLSFRLTRLPFYLT